MSTLLSKIIESAALMFTGSMLAIVSTGALIMLLISLPLTALEQGLAVATGVGLQASMYLLARFKGAGRLVSLVLLVVSIAASTAFIESAWQRHITELSQSQVSAKNETDAVTALKKERANAQRQIDIRTAAAAKDSAGSYTTRAMRRLDAVNQYQNRITEINAQLTQLQQTTTANGADRGSIQALFVDTARSTRLAAFAVLAALIDIAAILLFARVDVSVFRSIAAVRAGGQPFNTVMSRTDSVTMSRTDSVLMQTDAVNNQLYADYQINLKQRILSGEFGLPISQRKAIDEVKNVFNELIAAGRIEKAAKGFKVC